MSLQQFDQNNQGSGLQPPPLSGGIYGLWGDSNLGYGVIGTSNRNAPGGVTVGCSGVYGQNDAILGGVGVQGQANGQAGRGVYGRSDDPTGVGVIGTNGTQGYLGFDGAGAGVCGVSTQKAGVVGISDHVHGVRGQSDDGFGVAEQSGNVGVYAHNTAVKVGEGSNDAYLGARGFAGDFHGDVNIVGQISKSGGGFRIDHPCDATKKYLSHSFVESPDMKNIYDGVAVFDASGEAEVKLPSWFDALNTDFRYQLTCIGGYAPVYIAEEVHDSCFKIAGGNFGMKVSWQVTGIRQDAWANAHRIRVEEEKSAEEQGYYLYPELYGESDEKHIRDVRYPELMKQRMRMKEGGQELEAA